MLSLQLNSVECIFQLNVSQEVVRNSWPMLTNVYHVEKTRNKHMKKQEIQEIMSETCKTVIAYDRSLVSERLQSTLDYSRPKRRNIFCPVCCLQACRCCKTHCTPLCSKWCERTTDISIQLNYEIAWNSQVINRDLCCSHHLSTDLLIARVVFVAA